MGKQKKTKKEPKQKAPKQESRKNLVLSEWNLADLQAELDPGSQISGGESLYTGLNPLSRALNAVTWVARDESAQDKPKVLQKIGQQLNNLIPPGYERTWNPPLTVKQLQKFLCDPEAAKYVQTARPGAVGSRTLKFMQAIVDACV